MALFQKKYFPCFKRIKVQFFRRKKVYFLTLTVRVNKPHSLLDCDFNVVLTFKILNDVVRLSQISAFECLNIILTDSMYTHYPAPAASPSLHFIPSKTMLQYYTLYPFGSAPAGKLPARLDFLLEKQTRRGSAKMVRWQIGEHGNTETSELESQEAGDKATAGLTQSLTSVN